MLAWKRERVCPLFAGKLLEPVQIARLSHFSGPRCEVVTLYRSGKSRRGPKKTASLGGGEAREPCRIEIGSGAVGRLDDCEQLRRKRDRQSEPHMDCGQQAGLDGLVGVADHSLGCCDHVPN